MFVHQLCCFAVMETKLSGGVVSSSVSPIPAIYGPLFYCCLLRNPARVLIVGHLIFLCYLCTTELIITLVASASSLLWWWLLLLLMSHFYITERFQSDLHQLSFVTPPGSTAESSYCTRAIKFGNVWGEQACTFTESYRKISWKSSHRDENFTSFLPIQTIAWHVVL